MPEIDSAGRPIQVFLNTRQFIQVQKSRAGGGNRDFFAGDDRSFARHKDRMRQKVRDAADGLRQQNQPAGFVVVQMREEGLAKSYRPINALFSENNRFGLVGGGRVGQMYFQCTPAALDKLDRVIEAKAELHPRMVENEKTGQLEPRVTPYRSELGGIADIALPTAADRIGFSAREAMEWLQNPGTLGGYIVELFRPHWSVEPTEVHRMIGQFRERLGSLGGIVALPVTRARAGENGHKPIAISVHLGAESDARSVLLPIPGEAPVAEAETAARSIVESLTPMGDLPIERHQTLLDMLAAEPMIRRVELPPVIQGTPLGHAEFDGAENLPAPQPGRSYPVVGIVDGGVAGIPALAAWRAGGGDGIDPADKDEGHGTFIAGLVSGGRHFNPHIEAELERDGCRFYDLDLMPRPGLVGSYYSTPEEFFDQLEEQVVRAKEEAGARIFNLSLGAPNMRKALGYTIFAQALDELARTHDVIFVVSAGNLNGAEARPPWAANGDDAVAMLASRAGASERITAPAEHLLGLTVGAINPPGIGGHVPEVPTTYTRRGPGAGGARKPELCHFGGVSPRAGNRTGLFSLGADGSVVDSNGTSFAAPFVSATLATLDHRLEGRVPRETLLALPVHRAERCRSMQHKALKHVARDFVGFGKAPASDVCLADDQHSVTLVFTETLMARRELNFVFTWPRSLVLGDGKCRGKVDLTLVYTPPIDANFDAECLRVQLEAYLHQLEIDPDTGEEKPESRLNHFDNALPQGLEYTERYLLDSGLKWTPIKRYTLSMPKGRGTSSDWRLSLRSFTRAGASYPDEGVPFALIMTIADSTGTAAIYDEVRNEIIRRGLDLADITVAHRVRTRG
jgi:hypothetical protein